MTGDLSVQKEKNFIFVDFSKTFNITHSFIDRNYY